MALLLGGPLVGGSGGGARDWKADEGIAGLDPGIGGRRLDLFAAIEGVTGDVGDASFDTESIWGIAAGSSGGGCRGRDGSVGGGAFGWAPGGAEGGSSRLTERELSVVGTLRDEFRVCRDISSSDSEPSLGDNICPGGTACPDLAADEGQ